MIKSYSLYRKPSGSTLVKEEFKELFKKKGIFTALKLDSQDSSLGLNTTIQSFKNTLLLVSTILLFMTGCSNNQSSQPKSNNDSSPAPTESPIEDNTSMSIPTQFSISENNFINNTYCDQIINKTYLKVCYDYALKAPRAVSYLLQGELVNAINIDERQYFKAESTTPSQYRASYSDYTHSGWDRGHLAPDASFDWSLESLNETYVLSNIIPQARKVNRYTWTKAERYARFMAVQLGQVNVINVVKYSNNPERIGSHGIAVPVGFYKVLYSDDQNYSKCLYYKNDNSIITSDDKLRDHEVPCKEVAY